MRSQGAQLSGALEEVNRADGGVAAPLLQHS